jgi:hypothetical protein
LAKARSVAMKRTSIGAMYHVRTGGRFDAIGTDCAAIDTAVQESELVVLRRQIT